MKSGSMFRIILFLLLPILSIGAIGQLNPTDKIQTRAGKMYQGIIIEQTPGASIKLFRTTEMDTVEIMYPDIARILRVFDQEPAAQKPSNPENDYNWWSPCFNCRKTYVMLHFLGAGGDEEILYLGAGLSFGYNIKRVIQIGLGASVMGSIEQERNARTVVPLTLDIRYVFSESKRGRGAFLLGFSPGVNVPMYSSADADLQPKAGLFFSGTFGFRFNVTSQFGFLLDFGYMPNSLNFYSKSSGEYLRQQWYQMGMIRGSVFF